MCAKNGEKDKIRTEYYYHGIAWHIALNMSLMVVA